MKTADTPLISVIMGVFYRKADTALLERSVWSILEQTYGNFEFLICDDGSSREAADVLDRFAEQDERIKLVRGIQRTDLAAKLNACLRLAKGAYIARMDDDDWSEPQRFEKQVCYLEQHLEATFVGCNAYLVKDGCWAGKRVFPEKPTVQDFYISQPFLHPTLMFQHKILRQIGGYCELDRCIGCEDYDLLLRLYESRFYGVNIQDCLLIYTLPPAWQKRRTMKLRWNEVKTRFICFRRLELLPKSFFFVIKPILVGLIPGRLADWLKMFFYGHQ